MRGASQQKTGNKERPVPGLSMQFTSPRLITPFQYLRNVGNRLTIHVIFIFIMIEKRYLPLLPAKFSK